MIVDQQFEAVVRAGLFRDRQHGMQEALHTLFTVRPQLRTEAAVELFRSGGISLLRAVEAVCSFLDPTVDGIWTGADLVLVEWPRREILAVKDLPGSLGAGEAEAIAVCLHRPGTRLLTNDKRARNLCRERGIPCLDLP